MTKGGPGSATETIGTFIYNKAFSGLQFGYGTAIFHSAVSHDPCYHNHSGEIHPFYGGRTVNNVSHRAVFSGEQMTRFLSYFVLILFAFLIVFPLVYIGIMSVSHLDLASYNLFSFIKEPNFSNYPAAWIKGKTPHYFFNTLFIAVGTVVIVVIVALFCGYAFRRFILFFMILVFPPFLFFGLYFQSVYTNRARMEVARNMSVTYEHLVNMIEEEIRGKIFLVTNMGFDTDFIEFFYNYGISDNPQKTLRLQREISSRLKAYIGYKEEIEAVAFYFPGSGVYSQEGVTIDEFNTTIYQ